MVEKIVQPPYGFSARKYFSFFTTIAFFQWDEKKISKKLEILEDKLACKVKEGSGFKSVLGTTVIILIKTIKY